MELTAAEQGVAVLAAAGLINAAIAGRRGTSTRTADAQLASILSKLTITSRKDILPLLPAAEREHAVAEISAASVGSAEVGVLLMSRKTFGRVWTPSPNTFNEFQARNTSAARPSRDLRPLASRLRGNPHGQQQNAE
ncbi:LuxR C-terminal-related transcriptional regulator [Nocardia tengchongensis]|uniref:LuxR C-terminal-related transcriptional regulator n=1 Tax=Nocardia tengchongensis TaxID=2055889 RepID=UPI0036C7B9D1